MWELKRKIIYTLATLVTLAAVAVFFLRGVLFPEPTCFDGKKNGFEVNVDCGGVCNLMCAEEVKPLWAKAVYASRGLYDLVALINNDNINNSSKEIGYRFTLYDSNGSVQNIYVGSTTSPLDGKFPIIIQNIPLEKVPTNVVVELSDGLHYKVLESPTSPTVRILDKRYQTGSVPSVQAIVANTKRLEINNLPVRALLYDANDNVYAVGQTIIPRLEKEGTENIIFTWREPLSVVPTRINIYPIFNPFQSLGE